MAEIVVPRDLFRRILEDDRRASAKADATTLIAARCLPPSGSIGEMCPNDAATGRKCDHWAGLLVE